MIYDCQILGLQNTALVTKVAKLQEKAIRIINFKPLDTPTDNLFKEDNI